MGAPSVLMESERQLCTPRRLGLFECASLSLYLHRFLLSPSVASTHISELLENVSPSKHGITLEHINTDLTPLQHALLLLSPLSHLQ